jgi:hypothetical protein
MKLVNCLFAIALAFSVMGCSENDAEDSFEWTDEDAIAPILSNPETGSELFSGYQNCVHIQGVASELLRQNGIHFEGFSASGDDPQSEAIVINDQQVITDIVEQFGFDSETVGLEAKEYSLVVGYVYTPMGGYEIHQRAKQVLGKAWLHLTAEQVYLGLASPCYTCFMALYDTELPSGPVDKIYRTYK